MSELRRSKARDPSSPRPLSRDNRFDQDPKEQVEARGLTKFHLGAMAAVVGLLFVGLVLLDGPDNPGATDEAGEPTTSVSPTVTFPLDTSVEADAADEGDVVEAVPPSTSVEPAPAVPDAQRRPLDPTLSLGRGLGDGRLLALTSRHTIVDLDLASGVVDEYTIRDGTGSLLDLNEQPTVEFSDEYLVVNTGPAVLWSLVDRLAFTIYPPRSLTEVRATTDGFVWASSRGTDGLAVVLYPPPEGRNVANLGQLAFPNTTRILGATSSLAAIDLGGRVGVVALDGDDANELRTLGDGVGIAFDGEFVVRLVCPDLDGCELHSGPVDDPDRWVVDLPPELNRADAVDWTRNAKLSPGDEPWLAIDVNIGAGRTMAAIDLETGDVDFNISRLTDHDGVGPFAWGPNGTWMVFPLDGDLLVWEPFVTGRSDSFRIRLSRPIVALAIGPTQEAADD